MARKAAKAWRDHGALEVCECWADDVKPGKVTSFPQAVKLKAGEAVALSWTVYKSRAARDRISTKVMKDPRLPDMMDPKTLPFDGKRMFWGGFKTIVEELGSLLEARPPVTPSRPPGAPPRTAP